MKTKPSKSLRRHVAITTLTVVATLLSATTASRADTIYVSGWVNNTIQKCDLATGKYLGVFASTGLNRPTGLAFDRAGNLYVTNKGNDTIEKFTLNGVESVFATTASMPEGLAFDSAGNLLVTAFNTGIIQKFTPQGVGSYFAGVGPAGPCGLAIDSAGNVYTTLGTFVRK